MKFSRIVLSLTLLGACGDDGSSISPVDAPAIDAPPPNPIVGRYERDPYNGTAKPIVIFEANGTYRYGSDVGTWSITGDHLTTTRANAPTETAPYYLSEDRQTLMMVAFRPTSATNGLVGTWSSDYTYENGRHTETTFEFRDDNTLTWTEVSSTYTRPAEGTWELDDNSILIAATLGTTPVNVGMKLVPDVVIGDALLHRME